MTNLEPPAETVRLFRDRARFFRNAEQMFSFTSAAQVLFGPRITPQRRHAAVGRAARPGVRLRVAARAAIDALARRAALIAPPRAAA